MKQKSKFSKRGFLDAPELTPEDVFLISYPRSGNTWMRVIIAYLLYPHNEISSLESLNHLVPDIHVGIPRKNIYSQPRVIKSHRLFPVRHERESPELYNRNIYIVRHPFNVIRSYYHYMIANNWIGVEGLSISKFASLVIQGAIIPGSWQEHVLSWYSMSDRLNNIFVRYEDLQKDTNHVIQKVANFLKKPINVNEADMIRQKSSREAMVSLENRGSLGNSDFKFVRRSGRKRLLAKDLSENSKKLIWEYSHIAMDLFGYNPEND